VRLSPQIQKYRLSIISSFIFSIPKMLEMHSNKVKNDI
jgi:hypothetical protein